MLCNNNSCNKDKSELEIFEFNKHYQSVIMQAWTKEFLVGVITLEDFGKNPPQAKVMQNC